MFKQLKDTLLKTLQPELEAFGFRLVKSREWFERKHCAGKDLFLLDFAEYDYLQVQPTVRLRLDEVEDVFHRTSEFEKKYQPDTATLAASLQSLFGDPELFEYGVTCLEDVPVVTAQLLRDFKTVVLPYFEENRNLPRIDSLLNDQPENPCAHNLMEYMRCAHGLIVAKLTNRTNYNDLRETYRTKMSAISDGFYLPKLDALIADLAGVPVRNP